jgi:hypothetical protein
MKELTSREGWNPLDREKQGHAGAILDLLPIPKQGNKRFFTL